MRNSSIDLGTSSSGRQKSIDETLLSSVPCYEKIFRGVLFIAEEELAFTKLEPLRKTVKAMGMKLGSSDKLNRFACVEMIDILAEVVTDISKQLIQKSHFISLASDASEARKTSEEKELIFSKVLIRGYKGFVPCTFKCQSLKRFGGGTAEGTFEAMKDAALQYVDEEKFKIMLVSLAADGAAVNFGKNAGAL